MTYIDIKKSIDTTTKRLKMCKRKEGFGKSYLDADLLHGNNWESGYRYSQKSCFRVESPVL
jgi:hypothetical protein